MNDYNRLSQVDNSLTDAFEAMLLIIVQVDAEKEDKQACTFSIGYSFICMT